jgi:hypothetical protein
MHPSPNPLPFPPTTCPLCLLQCIPSLIPYP